MQYRSVMRSLLLLFGYLGIGVWGHASQNIPGKTDKSNNPALRTSAVCLPASSSATLDINNVRALVHNGGDMWWDLVGQPQYEVPKVDNPADARHSMFAGSLWIGGLDDQQILRLAAQTYRQSGNDFFAGPLPSLGSNLSIDKTVCDAWNKHFKITKAEIDAFRQDFADDGQVNLGNYPNVRDWPGNNTTPGYDFQLAPYKDVDGDQTYTPAGGDYPDILGDQAIWWVINDKGNIHTETQAEQIGIEIQVMAFGFATTNAINNMTFYKQKVINKSTLKLNQTYIGQWVDSDIGFAFDDYVGCDTVRGLGFAYNGDPFDEGPQGYGFFPPAAGVDFFQGPTADANDGIDNDKDGLTDEPGERIGMARFVYYENDFSIRGNPTNAAHFYGYLTGFWKDGSPIVNDNRNVGGNNNGYPDPGEANNGPTKYMFPDYPGNGCDGIKSPVQTNPAWKEDITPYDRRFIQSAGPFTLQPGAVNEIVIGVVWARDQTQSLDVDNYAAVCLLLRADDIAQALFDNNFDLLDGPDAPNMFVSEYDQELVLNWENNSVAGTNNPFENYAEVDPVLAKDIGRERATFKFQGYMVYQLVNNSVSASELSDPDRARLVFQCDIEDGVSTIVNREERTILGLDEPVIVDEIMVQGKNKGLSHSVRITTDLFAEGSTNRLVNYRTYYYCIIAYAYNDTSSDGRKFIPGNGNFKRYAAIPHKTEFENFGTILNSQYGSGPNITRVAGKGNNGNFLRLTPESEAQILQNGSVSQPEYLGGFAPVTVKVVDPKNVRQEAYRLEVVEEQLLGFDLDPSVPLAGGAPDTIFRYADWILYARDANTWRPIYTSVYTKRFSNNAILPVPLSGTERVIIEQTPQGEINHGISISVKDVFNPGADTGKKVNNGLIGSSITYKDPTKQWYFAFPDVNDANRTYNWIRVGTAEREPPIEALANYAQEAYRRAQNYDPGAYYEKVVGSGGFAPYILTATYNTQIDLVGARLKVNTDPLTFVNGCDINMSDLIQLSETPNIDIVITKDQSLWSRCVVVESSPSQVLSTDLNGFVGGAAPMAARYAFGRDINGNVQTDPANYGMSYFPGYAINVDNGQRVNIFFSESSFHRADNGNDMLFNPSANEGSTSGSKVAHGRHYIFVTNQPYDGCEQIRRVLQAENGQATVTTNCASPHIIRRPDGSETDLLDAYRHVAWLGVAGVNSEIYEFTSYDQIPSDVRIELRVNQSFSKVAAGEVVPVFEFGTDSLASVNKDNETAVKALVDLVNIVPNPFYGKSGVGQGRYELNQLDTRAKITNLPFKCLITIMTLNGNVVRTFRKESDEPFQDWDLKNDYGVPIASGLYIIHIDAGDLGEKVLKFFCIMPQVDLSAY